MARNLVAAVIFLAIFVAIRSAMIGDPIRKSLQRLRNPRSVVTEVPKDDTKKKRSIGVIFDRLLDLRSMRPLATRLAQADLKLKPGEALFGVAVFAVILTALLSHLIGPIGIPGGLVLTLFIGNFVVGFMQKRRLSKMEQALPDFLQGVANGVRAGHALGASLEAAASQGDGPLEQEIQRAVGQTRLGIPLEEALQELAKRMALVEMDLAVTAILVQRQVGGNLAEVLDRIQETLRERVRVAGEVKALTAQGRLSGMVVGALPIGIALMMSVMSPSFIAPLTQTALGHVMILVAGGLELAGAFAISRLVKVEF